MFPADSGRTRAVAHGFAAVAEGIELGRKSSLLSFWPLNNSSGRAYTFAGMVQRFRRTSPGPQRPRYTAKPASTTRPTRPSLSAQPSQGRRPREGGFLRERGRSGSSHGGGLYALYLMMINMSRTAVCTTVRSSHNARHDSPQTLKDRP